MVRNHLHAVTVGNAPVQFLPLRTEGAVILEGQGTPDVDTWVKWGVRLCAPQDLRTQSARIFAAIDPAQVRGRGFVLPRCTFNATTLRVAEIAHSASIGQAVFLDAAGFPAAHHKRATPCQVPEIGAT